MRFKPRTHLFVLSRCRAAHIPCQERATPMQPAERKRNVEKCPLYAKNGNTAHARLSVAQQPLLFPLSVNCAAVSMPARLLLGIPVVSMARRGYDMACRRASESERATGIRSRRLFSGLQVQPTFEIITLFLSQRQIRVQRTELTFICKSEQSLESSDAGLAGKWGDRLQTLICVVFIVQCSNRRCSIIITFTIKGKQEASALLGKRIIPTHPLEELCPEQLKSAQRQTTSEATQFKRTCNSVRKYRAVSRDHAKSMLCCLLCAM